MFRSRALHWPIERLLTEKAEKVLHLAAEEATLNHESDVSPRHLLLALLKDGSGVAVLCLRRLRLDPDELLGELTRITSGGNLAPDRNPELDQHSAAIIQQARLQAHSLGHRYIGTEHLLLGLVNETQGENAEFLKRYGVTPSILRDHLIRVLHEPPPSDWVR
ncbi:Clp protease N-terminal domain-containing protein [Streptosporangium sp. NPDC006007]|uniref:Clp protease N-terminal domain-containing protein n=1 Tax=Streptosporangium sp. NPDC006007 TaxID=3154575 RepID=UPI0033BC519A